MTEHRHLVEAGRRARSRADFDRVKKLRAEGKSLADIVRETGFNWRTVHKWTRLEAMRLRATMAPKPTTPSGFSAYLARRWNEGCTMGKQLLAEIRPLGYTGSLTHLQRLLNSWRRAHFAAAIGIPVPQATAALHEPAAHAVPPIVAAALCITLAACASVSNPRGFGRPPAIWVTRRASSTTRRVRRAYG